jgi:hypothetical protein
MTFKKIRNMKKILFIIITFTLSMSVYAQNGERIKNRVQSQRIGFITQRLDLTPEESQKFWPIYNQFTEKLKQIRSAAKLEKPIAEMTDADAEKMIMEQMDKDTRELELRKEYFQKLKTAISVKKIAKLYKAERDFKAEMLKQLKEVRDMKQMRKGQN